MDPTVFIIILLAACLVLIIALFLLIRKVKNGKKKLLQSFADMSAQYDLSIDTKELFKRRIVGIDRFKLRLLFIDRSNGVDHISMIDLREIAFCHVKKRKNISEKHISKISIECILKKNQEMVHLTFYDDRYDSVSEQLKLAKSAERWRKKIRTYQNYSDVLNENEYVF